MPLRIRRLLSVLVLLGLATGCAHRPSAPVASAVRPVPLPALQKTAPPFATRTTAPGTPFVRSRPDAPFEPSLVVTTQVAHGDIFAHTLDSAAPRYQSATRLWRGQVAYLLPFAANYGLAPDHRTDLTYELAIRRPDGTADGAPVSAALWQDSAPDPGSLLYPATSVAFHAEANDPPGDYVITARVTDHLSGETRELIRTIAVEDYLPPARPPAGDGQCGVRAYYQQPAPELALPALPLLFTRLPADQRAGALPPLLGFYDQLLTDNGWLLPAFCSRLAAAGADEAYILSVLLGFHLRKAGEPPAGMDFASWVRLEDFRTHAWPSDPDGPLAQASQLDTLWGRFFASGLYNPVERILASLANHADLGATDRWQKARIAAGMPVDLSPEALAADEADYPEFAALAPPSEVRRDVLLRTALWSLRGNSRQHPLLRSYLDWTLRAGDLPPAEKQLLQRILAADPAPATQAALHPAPAATAP